MSGTSHTAKTDSQGNFSIFIEKGGIKAGDYMLAVSATGFMPLTEAITLRGEEGESVSLEKQMTLSHGIGIPGDFNGNGLLGLEDSIGILQILSGTR